MKRLLDLVIAVPAAIVTAPLILLLCVLIRLESRGDPIFRQTRAGRHGVPFRIYKLRTMVDNAQTMGAGDAILADDFRLTRSGKWLRRTSLDELPNLWNVIRGEMSIVGPRPTLPSQVEQYTPRQRRRLDVRPGITGWAQIHGPRGASAGPSGSSSTSTTSSTAPSPSICGSSRGPWGR